MYIYVIDAIDMIWDGLAGGETHFPAWNLKIKPESLGNAQVKCS